MSSFGQNSAMTRGEGRGIVAAEANFGKPSRGELEAMARRRFQNPVPKREGKWWYLLYWVDTFSDGKTTRKRKRHKLAPGDIPEREAKKMAAEFLRPMNQGLVPIGSATKFEEYVETVYKIDLVAAPCEEHPRPLRGSRQELSQAGVWIEVFARSHALNLTTVFLGHDDIAPILRIAG